jgi:hypothetical protein
MLLSGKTIQPPENFQNAQILQDALAYITTFLSSEA